MFSTSTCLCHVELWYLYYVPFNILHLHKYVLVFQITFGFFIKLLFHIFILHLFYIVIKHTEYKFVLEICLFQLTSRYRVLIFIDI